MIFHNDYYFLMEKNSDCFYQKISSEIWLIMLIWGPYTEVYCFTYSLNEICKPIECQKKGRGISVRCKQLKKTDCFNSDNSSNVVCATVLLKWAQYSAKKPIFN